MKKQYLSAEVASPIQAILGESPTWDIARSVLWWVDIERPLLHSFNPRQGMSRSLDIGWPATSIVCTESRKFLIAGYDRIAAFDAEAADLRTLVQVELFSATSRFNDGKCDPAGRFWVGSLSFDAKCPARESLYALDTPHGLRRMLSNVSISNGIAWSANCKVMYYIDSSTRTVDAFDFDLETGAICNRRVAFDVPQDLGIADGMTIDSEDMLWVAFWGSGCVARIDPVAHAVVSIIHLPINHVTSCAFGGDALDQLYVTTARYGLSPKELVEQPRAGNLFVANVGVCGLPPTLFRDGLKVIRAN